MCAVISPKVRIGCDRVRQQLVYRIAYIVYRENKKQREKNKGLEANPNASSGRRVSFTNASESGRLRRRSDSDGGEGVPVPPPATRISYFVCRISPEKRQREKNVGLEANPNASCGRKVSLTNASEGGRLRRK